MANKTAKFIGVLVALALAAAAAWYLLRPAPPAPPPPPPPPAQQAPAKTADVPLPPPAESDAQVRGALAAVSPRKELQKWLQEHDLLDRWTVVADNLAEGVSPRKQLAFLAPEKKFLAAGREGNEQIDPRSYQRYDLFAEVVSSVDAQALAAAVRALHPLLEATYHKLGYPDRKLDEVAQKALQRLLDAPVVEGPLQIVPKGAVYKFAVPELEALGPIEKHLLRMGPRNTRLIQAKARELSATLQH